MILMETNLNEFIPQLIKILVWITSKKQLVFEDFRTVNKIFALFSAIFIFSEDALEQFYNYRDPTDEKMCFKNLILQGMYVHN